jgi:hypothetical protein
MSRDGRSPLVDNFKVKGRNIFLNLMPTNGQSKQSCFNLPLVRKFNVKGLKPAYAQISNLYQDERQTDTASYSMPEDCQVNNNDQARSYSGRSQEQQGHSQQPNTFDCPKDVKDECPVCDNSLNNVARKEACSADLAVVGREKNYQTSEYEDIYNSQQSSRNESEKRCVAFPFKIRETILSRQSSDSDGSDDSKTINFYMLEKCHCSSARNHGKYVYIFIPF